MKPMTAKAMLWPLRTTLVAANTRCPDSTVVVADSPVAVVRGSRARWLV
jgi:hypothetical protein